MNLLFLTQFHISSLIQENVKENIEVEDFHDENKDEQNDHSENHDALYQSEYKDHRTENYKERPSIIDCKFLFKYLMSNNNRLSNPAVHKQFL